MFLLRRTTCVILLITSVASRPFDVPPSERGVSYTGTLVQHFVRELDSWVASVLSQPPVPLVGAGAALAYIGYAGSVLLTNGEHQTRTMVSARSADQSSDLISGLASNIVNRALENTESAAAFRKAGARALHHGATVLRRGLGAFSRLVAALYSTLTSGQRALSSDCVAVKLCRIGQVTGMQWPFFGALLRGLDSADVDEYSRALIDGTTVGDCKAIYPKCPD